MTNFDQVEEFTREIRWKIPSTTKEYFLHKVFSRRTIAINQIYISRKIRWNFDECPYQTCRNMVFHQIALEEHLIPEYLCTSPYWNSRDLFFTKVNDATTKSEKFRVESCRSLSLHWQIQPERTVRRIFCQLLRFRVRNRFLPRKKNHRTWEISSELVDGFFSFSEIFLTANFCSSGRLGSHKTGYSSSSPFIKVLSFCLISFSQWLFCSKSNSTQKE